MDVQKESKPHGEHTQSQPREHKHKHKRSKDGSTKSKTKYKNKDSHKNKSKKKRHSKHSSTSSSRSPSPKRKKKKRRESSEDSDVEIGPPAISELCVCKMCGEKVKNQGHLYVCAWADVSQTGVKFPMTKEEWEKQQSVIRRVYDPDTGRERLVRGSGEIIEEIVSKERQKQINKAATVGDGAAFESMVGIVKKS